MSANKQKNRLEVVRNAATGYTVVVLAIMCFVLALATIMTGVRIISGVTATTTTAATTTVIVGNGTS